MTPMHGSPMHPCIKRKGARSSFRMGRLSTSLLASQRSGYWVCVHIDTPSA